MTDGVPPRAPAACGALGTFDRARVERMAAAFGCDLSAVHEDDRSLLMLDREPIRWAGREEQGLGWIEGDIWRGRPSGPANWEQAATLGACGLVIAGRKRFVHSSISGLAPVYWIEGRGATYFASRIDPLVQTAPGLLSVDWDAWASIIALRYPLGDRTPFEEIRRLGPHRRLRRRLGRARVESPAWPWAEVEASPDIEAGIGAAAEALRDSLAPFGQLVCPLSGGLDSRLLLSAAAERKPRSLIAITTSDDEGDLYEEELAQPVARELGARHECVTGRVDDYPKDSEERARRVEHQFSDHAWLMPVAQRVAGTQAAVLDGYAIDTLLQTAARFDTPEILESNDPRSVSQALFDGLRVYGHGHRALDESLHRSIVERSRDQYLEEVRPFEGRPSHPILAIYATRTVRGISTVPTGLLGLEAQVITPGAHDPVATAILSIPVSEKVGQVMRLAVQRRFSPRCAELPATPDVPRNPPRLPRRWRSDPAVDARRGLISDGPLAPYVVPELTEWLNAPERPELSHHLRAGMEGIALMHSWWRRYSGRLRDPDPDRLRG